MAVLQTWPTLGVSWGKRAYPCYVWPNWQGRTGHIPSIHSYSAWCIYEGTEEKEAGWGQYPGRVDYAAWLRAARSGAWHVFGWPDDTSGSCSQPVVLPPLLVAYGTWRGLQCAVRHFIPGSWSAWIAPVHALLLLLDDVLVGPNRLARKASHCTSLVLYFLTLIYSPWKEASIIQLQSWLFQNLWGSHWWQWHGLLDLLDTGCDFRNMLGWLSLYTSMQCWASWSEWMEVWYPISCWRSCESRGIELCARYESEHVSLVSPFIDWSRFVGFVLVFFGGGLFALCCSFWLGDQSVRSRYPPMTSFA